MGTVALSAAITGNVTDQKMLDGDGVAFSGTGVDAGSAVILGTATSVDVTITDSRGKIIYTNTSITADDDEVDPTARGILGPLYVTTANISDGAHTLTVYQDVSGL